MQAQGFHARLQVAACTLSHVKPMASYDKSRPEAVPQVVF